MKIALAANLCVLLFAGPLGSTAAQALGVSSKGISGGLVIPNAQILPTGSIAFSYGDYQEPSLGTYSTHQNMNLGLGLLPNMELYGRYTNYVNPPQSGSILVNGVRDLSANAKVQLPLPWAEGPLVAFGANDIAGGAVNFGSKYVVASQQLGQMLATVGYTKNVSSKDGIYSGPFGGLEWRLGDSGVSLLTEHDGRQRHAGIRWQSQPLALLGQAQLIVSLDHSFDGPLPKGPRANGHAGLSLILPLDKGSSGLNGAAAYSFPSQARPELPEIGPSSSGAKSDDAQLEMLQKALNAVGLERVRLGQREGLLGATLVVEYENHRYAHNEADALGLVFGLAAELAPKSVQRIQAVTYRQGLRLYETSVGVTVYRSYLRSGPASHVRDSLDWQLQPPDSSTHTRWLTLEPGGGSVAYLELKPDLNYTLGTEVGSFDYATAADLGVRIPLWTGAQAQASYSLPLHHTGNMEDGAVFQSARQQRGLQSMTLSQSIWLGSNVLTSLAVGRFDYGKAGAQGEAGVFVPDTDDLLRFRATSGPSPTYAASYRHLVTPSRWLEVGAQRYTDNSAGPFVEWNQWFGDVGVQIFYRKGNAKQFAGLQFTFPLTPRQGMAPGPVVLSGTPSFSQAVRTRITTPAQPANLVQPLALRSARMAINQDVDFLNMGRLNQQYFSSQIFRMREAFFLYAAQDLVTALNGK